MANLVVAVLGAPGYSGSLGKKGTSTDVALYNLKKDEDTVTFIEPTKYPERLAPLFFSVSMAKKAVLLVNEINATFGECVVMLQSSQIKDGYIVLRNFLTKEKVEPLIKDTVLEKFEFIEDNPAVLRERLLNDVARQRLDPSFHKESAGPGTVPVDHSFNVKGVGTVVLGVVAKGVIRKHDSLRVLPGEKIAQILSIQKHDDEFDQAFKGDRVGLALKSVEVDDLERGVVLTNDDTIKKTNSITGEVQVVKYWQAPLKSGMVVHLGHWMQFIPARVESVNLGVDSLKPVLTLNLEKELVHLPGDFGVITNLEGGKLRVVGTIELRN